MTATVDDKMWQALKTRIELLSSLHPICWYGDADFVKPTDANGPLPYLEVQHIPNANARFLIGSDAPHDRFGIVQIAAMVPAHLKWTYETRLGLAGKIAAYFPTDHKMRFQGVEVRVEKAPDISREYRDDAYWRVPVSIRYQSFC